MFWFDDAKEGIEISFETRGVDDETVEFIWNQLSPEKIKKLVEKTGQNLVVYDKNGKQVAVYIKYNETKQLHKKVYTVSCMKNVSEG